jgi:large-conductance mechanosensitive channel
MSAFNYYYFINFLKDNQIIATIIATIISTYITNLSMSFTNDILLPIINRDADGDGKKDIDKYENYIIQIYNIDFRIGSFIIEIFKFIIMTYLMFVLSKLLN